MENYMVLRKLGEGTFGEVWQAVNKTTGEIVAIKMIKKHLFYTQANKNFIEVRSLLRMNHPNVVQLKDVIRGPGELSMVFEYMETNFSDVITGQRGNPLSESVVRHWSRQLLLGLAHMHMRGYFHRDLKPANLLVSKDNIKIADFGSAQEIFSKPPDDEYVTSRWYRAPEVILKDPFYNCAVDIWAVGVIMAEMFMVKPLFPGASQEHQIYLMCSVLGTPNADSWAEGLQLADRLNFHFPRFEPMRLSSLMPSASDDAISLIRWLTSWDPSKRPTAEQALQHPFFFTRRVPRPFSSVETRADEGKCDEGHSAASTKINTVFSSMKAVAV